MFDNPIDFLWQMPYDKIKEFRECSCWERRDLHMNKDDNKKQQDINFMVELLQKESLDKVREVLVFIQNYLQK